MLESVLWVLAAASSGIWLYASCAVLLAAFGWSLAKESGWAATGATLGVLALVFGSPGGAERLAWSMGHPVLLGMAAAGYVALGAAWSVAKWFLYTQRLSDAFVEFKEGYLAKMGAASPADLSDADFEDFKRQAQSRMRGLCKAGASYPAKVGEHKAVLLMWSAYWPASAALTFLDEPVRRAFTWAYRRLNGVYEAISLRNSGAFRQAFERPGKEG